MRVTSVGAAGMTVRAEEFLPAGTELAR